MQKNKYLRIDEHENGWNLLIVETEREEGTNYFDERSSEKTYVFNSREDLMKAVNENLNGEK